MGLGKWVGTRSCRILRPHLEFWTSTETSLHIVLRKKEFNTGNRLHVCWRGDSAMGVH